MMKKTLMIALLASAVTAQVQAQSTPAAAPAPVAAPSAAKKDLLNRVIAAQQTALESTARSLAEQPLRQMIAAAQQAMQQVPEDKRAAAATQIEGLARKYADDVIPLAKDAVAKVAPTTLIPLLDQRFTEEELRQLVASLEAPAYKKYQTALPDLGNAFTEKLVAELRPTITPKLKTLEQNVGAALGLQPGAAGAEPAAPAKKASAPKAKK